MPPRKLSSLPPELDPGGEFARELPGIAGQPFGPARIAVAADARDEQQEVSAAGREAFASGANVDSWARRYATSYRTARS